MTFLKKVRSSSPSYSKRRSDCCMAHMSPSLTSFNPLAAQHSPPTIYARQNLLQCACSYFTKNWSVFKQRPQILIANWGRGSSSAWSSMNCEKKLWIWLLSVIEVWAWCLITTFTPSCSFAISYPSSSKLSSARSSDDHWVVRYERYYIIDT